MDEKHKFTKYERARIIGARGLQISMDAPLLIKIDKEELNGINYDPLKIAERELDSGSLPITINRPIPKRYEDAISEVKIDDQTPSDDAKVKAEEELEAEIVESGEMMKLNDSNDDDGNEEIKVSRLE